MWKWLIASVVFALIVIELVFFAPQVGDRQTTQDWVSEIEDEESPKQNVEQVISNAKLVESKGESKVWELTADKARKKQGSEDLHLKTVKVKFYGKKRVSYVATGDEGFVGEGQQKLQISGKVVVTSSNGYVMKTEVVYFRTDTKLIDGPEHVLLEGPPEKNGKGGPLFMNGDRFEADMNTNIINLYDNVHGRKKMSGGRNMKIRSEEAMFSGQSNYALFKRNVVIDVDSMTITGPRAKFIYKDNALHSMFIDGGVKIKDVGKWGVAGEAEVFFQEDKYIFRDNPKVVQSDDQLIGDEIIVYDGGDRVVVKKAKTRYNTDKAQQENGS